jgi:hypothetical protein
MILYNVTINIEDGSHDAWLRWMQKEHIPQVMDSGMFLSYKMFRLVSRFEDETGTTYSIQYFAESLEKYEIYKEVYAPMLQQETEKRFGGKFAAFRTILEEVQPLV